MEEIRIIIDELETILDRMLVGKKAGGYTITRVMFDDSYADEEYAPVNIYLKGYDDRTQDSLYTDYDFLNEIKSLLHLSPRSRIIDFSESGMQGQDFVNLDTFPVKLRNHLQGFRKVWAR